MPKIRGIKPDYWTDEDIVELTIPARLLFIGLWNFACDNGHLDDKPRQIKMRIMPGDAVDVNKLLEELVEQGRIQRENGTITIPKFAHHQKPHTRWWTCCDLPNCTRPDGSTTVEKGSSKAPNNGRQRETNGGNGGSTADGDGDGDGELMVKSAQKRATQLPKDWQPNETHRSFVASNSLNGSRELAQFRDHHTAKGSTMKDWDAAFRTWLRNAVEFGRGRPSLQAVPTLPARNEMRPPRGDDSA